MFPEVDDLIASLNTCDPERVDWLAAHLHDLQDTTADYTEHEIADSPK
jgi:hypothetical protein